MDVRSLEPCQTDLSAPSGTQLSDAKTDRRRIMLGTVSSLIFYNVPDRSGIVGLNWRLMLGSACLPALLVMIQVWFVPESPRCPFAQSAAF